MAWNARINLTGARTFDDLIAEHLPDAFALARALEEPAHVVDVGSGSGLPAIPLAILRPQLRTVLVEPLAKKVAFLRTAIRELALGAAVSVQSTRAEALGDAAYDVALSRATFPPPEWLGVARRLVRPGGRIMVLTTPATDLPGRRTVYLGGRRLLIDVRREECST
jgi:16S rRNA (guanine527-N7)-methyltransferase